MSVASVGTGVSFAPALEFPQRAQVQAARAEVAAKQFEASLPGNGREHPRPQLNSLASDLEQVSLAFNRKLQFVVDQQSNQVTVKVIDRETDKVVKVLPPEELQRLHSKLKETIGFLFDERV